MNETWMIENLVDIGENALQVHKIANSLRGAANPEGCVWLICQEAKHREQKIKAELSNRAKQAAQTKE